MKYKLLFLFCLLSFIASCGTVYRDIPDQDVTYLVRGIIMVEYNPGPPCIFKIFVDGYTHEYIGHFGCASRSVESFHKQDEVY